MKYLYSAFFTIFLMVQIDAQTENQHSMQDLQYPYKVHKVIVSDSLQIAYIDEGRNIDADKDAIVLLFIHGLGSNHKAWTKNINVLKKHYRCIALDLPGYGKSDKNDYPFSMTFFAEAVRAFVDTLHLEKVALVGHSMGAQIAIQTVLNNSENFEKLIVVAPAGLEVFTEKEKKWFQNIYTPAVVKATPEAQIIKNFQLNFYEMPDDAQFMIEDRLLMRQSTEYDHYCNMIPQCVVGMLNEPVFDQISEIHLPTLFIFGENDLLIPNRFLHPTLTTLEVAKSGPERIPDSRLEMIPFAGHFVHWEQAEIVNEKIMDFLN